jgi:hypothetical protein
MRLGVIGRQSAVPARGPHIAVLSQLEDMYKPVQFNHELHAKMEGMGEGCGACHHHTAPGEFAPCRECHPISPAESQKLRQPGLKGAYHRHCMGCHREWSHDTKCVVCHLPKEGDTPTLAAQDPTDIMGIPHPIITEPLKKVYDTPYHPAPIVTFQHKEHIDLFGFRCVDCHKKENCGNCHDLQKKPVAKTQEEIHAICDNCHSGHGCEKCHDKKERPGFSHNTVGWPLNPFHNKLDCWACHPKGKRVGKLSKMCLNCHSGWNQENFRHAVVGLQLDEVHSQLDCTDCHADRKYDEDPKCSDCHDDGRTADKAPPGMKVKSTSGKKN